jgi:hypothetical protein
MSEQNKQIAEIQGLLDDIDSAPYVSDWEAEFIDQMLKLTDKDRGLMPSAGQIDKIKQIHERRVK